MARPLWKGAINFGLVVIPVSLYPAKNAQDNARFHMLHGSDLRRVHNQWVGDEGHEVPYRPGVRGAAWVKTKCRHRQEFVIGGYTDPGGTRTGFGALLLGVQDEGRLRYVGNVGTGLPDMLLRDLGMRLRHLETEDSPFVEGVPAALRRRDAVHGVRPELVAEVEFLEWTAGGSLRHPSFVGLRDDKSADEVVVEEPVGAPGSPAASTPEGAPPAAPGSAPPAAPGSASAGDPRDRAARGCGCGAPAGEPGRGAGRGRAAGPDHAARGST